VTRFIAAELAKHHWFNITAAKKCLGYRPLRSMDDGMAELLNALRTRSGK
jgi:nucleoside-diphosphate-sugar epimerase